MKTEQKWKIGDCLELLPEIPDKSVDLVIADPPYYKIASDGWDNQWDSFDAYLKWIETRVIEIKRVLKDSGSLYLFGDDRSIAYIQVLLDQHFEFLNHLIWYKRNNQSIKGAENARRYVCVSERILFYGLVDGTGLQAIHEDRDCFKSIKLFLRSEYEKLRISKGFRNKEECNAYLNELTNTASVVTRHYFSDSQWVFPTKEHYLKLQSTGFFGGKYSELRKEYEELRKEYEELRKEYEELRRVFNYQHTYEMIDIPIINQNDNTDHSTTKPIKLIEKLIKASSNEGMTILDPFLGSGTTLEACMNLNRNCIGFEIDPQWEPIYRKRLRLDNAKLDAFNTSAEPKSHETSDYKSEASRRVH